MRHIGATKIAAVGAGLIAITYGLARYAFGLFVPAIRSELGLTPDVVGMVGSLAFVSFVFASLAAPWVADRLGSRRAAILASAIGLGGFVLISRAIGAVTLGTGVFACGVSTGLMMPALSAGVQAVVRPALQGRVNAIMNAGTSIGLVVCVPAVLFLAGAWRWAYASFALLTVIGLIAAWRLLPSASRIDSPEEADSKVTRAQWRALARLSSFGFAVGFVGAIFWIFAPDLVVQEGELASSATGLLWLALGLSGLAGAWASDMGDRIGAPAALVVALVATAGATFGIAAAPGNLLVALVAAGAFGWAAMTLSGLLLVTGVSLVPNRPSLGPVLPFVSITIGQAVGSNVAGWAINSAGYPEAFGAFALLALVTAAFAGLYPARSPSRAWQPAEPGPTPAEASAG